MNAHSITDSFIDPMTTSLRENRLVLERLVQWKGVEPGMIFSVTDSAVYALALGLLTHDEIETHLDMLAEPAEPITIVEGSPRGSTPAVAMPGWLQSRCWIWPSRPTASAAPQ